MKSKFKLLILALILILISFTVLISLGNTCTYKVRIIDDYNIDELGIDVEQDGEIIEIVDKDLTDHVLSLKIKSRNKGKAYIKIERGGVNPFESFYVHSFGIITVNQYFGHADGDIVIPISTIIFLTFLFINLIKKYQISVRKNMYQYKNIAYMGIIIFTGVVIVSLILHLFSYNGFIYYIEFFIGAFNFPILLLPIAFIVSILVILSNIQLLIKEGFTWRNMLGIFLGVFICFLTWLPEIMYSFSYNDAFIDIHNMGSIMYCAYNLLESLIYYTLTYLECVLIGTIVLSIKASRHIPSYDKDFIVILGCQIKKDGSLTNLLKGRVDKALEFAKCQKDNTGKDIIYVPSGGKGNDEIKAEALSMKEYLISEGVSEKNILIEDKSTNTYENIRFSKNIIDKKKKNAKIVFSTTKYHVFRAGLIATELNILMDGIGSKTKIYFWINAFIREFIATIFKEKKKHILIMLMIIILLTVMNYFVYLYNNL